MGTKQKGFTLIELMIVIAIIAILMAYAIPAYRDFTVRSRISEGTAMAAAFKTAVSQAFVENGTLTGLNNNSNGIPSSASPGHCVDTITVVNGEITVRFNCLVGSRNQADVNVDVAVLVWTPLQVANDALQWTCAATVNSPDQNPCN